MRLFRFLLSHTILYCLFWGVGFIFAEDRGELAFTISLEKETYMVDEPIYLEILSQNISDHEVTILPMILGASWGHFKIVLRDQTGQPLRDYTPMKNLDASPEESMDIMAPGERALEVIDLLEIFGQWDAAHQVRLFLPEGKYDVQVIYHSTSEALSGSTPQHQHKRALISNRLQFEVIKPTGFEEFVYKELHLTLLLVENSKNPAERIAAFEKFMNKYPNSRYLAVAHTFLLIEYSMAGNLEKRQNLINIILTRFPNSGLTYQLLRWEDAINKELASLAKSSSSTTKTRILEKLGISKSDLTRANYYMDCIVEMYRTGFRSAERRQHNLQKR